MSKGFTLCPGPLSLNKSLLLGAPSTSQEESIKVKRAFKRLSTDLQGSRLPYSGFSVSSLGSSSKPLT